MIAIIFWVLYLWCRVRGRVSNCKVVSTKFALLVIDGASDVAVVIRGLSLNVNKFGSFIRFHDFL